MVHTVGSDHLLRLKGDLRSSISGILRRLKRVSEVNITAGSNEWPVAE